MRRTAVRPDPGSEQPLPPEVEHGILIDAPPAAVWEVLTDRALLAQWMGEPEMRVEVVTDWIVGGPIVVRGFHHAPIVNTGTVLRFDPCAMLRYSQLSSISRLPDDSANYSVVDFRLAPVGRGTRLIVTLSNFPTHAIYKHLDFYWRGTLHVLKRFVETRANAAPAP